jgi:hypothetical protein
LTQRHFKLSAIDPLISRLKYIYYFLIYKKVGHKKVRKVMERRHSSHHPETRFISSRSNRRLSSASQKPSQQKRLSIVHSNEALECSSGISSNSSLNKNLLVVPHLEIHSFQDRKTHSRKLFSENELGNLFPVFFTPYTQKFTQNKQVSLQIRKRYCDRLADIFDFPTDMFHL